MLAGPKMGYYYTPARGTMEIMGPKGLIMQPEGSIMCPEGCIISIGPRAGVL